MLTDEDGAGIASDRLLSGACRRRRLSATREFFKTTKAQSYPHFVLHSGVLRGSVSGRNFFSLSRRRQAPDGQFLGVISVGLSEGYFTDFYRSIAGTEKDLAVMLLREDGTPLVSFPTPTSSIGAYASTNAMMRIIHNGGLHRSGMVTCRSRWRAPSRRRSQDRPTIRFTLPSGSLRSTVMAHWSARMSLAAGFVLPATIALVLLCWTALRKVGREHQPSAQLRAEDVTRRVTAEEALMRAQKMDAIGQMTGGVARHDFNNMLQIVSSRSCTSSVLKLPDAGIDAQLAAIDRARLSGESLTRQLLAFSRQRGAAPRSDRPRCSACLRSANSFIILSAPVCPS